MFGRAALVLVLLLASTSAAADPTTHIKTEEPRLLCVPPISATARCRDIPPGHFVDEVTWSKLDAELRRSQNQETRLGAENTQLRKSMKGWRPGWRSLLTAAILGVAGGWYTHSKL